MIVDVEHLGNFNVRNGTDSPTLTYKAKEIHFNGPSEHKFDGHRYDMELQIFHDLEHTTGDVPFEHSAIVSVLF